jgi:hypothetical protein
MPKGMKRAMGKSYAKKSGKFKKRVSKNRYVYGGIANQRKRSARKHGHKPKW